MSVRLTFFAHSTTTDNERGIATGWRHGELSDRGRLQALELRLLAARQSFEAVYCSDLQRAAETAELVFADRCVVIRDVRLRECDFGALTGSPSSSFKDRLTGYIDVPFPNGESYLDVGKRVANFLAGLKGRHDDGHIAIVSHQAPQLALEVLLNGKNWQQAIADDWRKSGAWQPGWQYLCE